MNFSQRTVSTPVVVPIFEKKYIDKCEFNKAKRYLGVEPVYIMEWDDTPTIAGLCNYIGMSTDTFQNYAKQDEYRKVIAAAKQLIMEHWEKKLANVGHTAVSYLISHIILDGRMIQRFGQGRKQKSRNQTNFH